ncbi:MAG: hypothetical protein ACLTBV_31575 [Enterocloster bolteae]
MNRQDFIMVFSVDNAKPNRGSAGGKPPIATSDNGYGEVTEENVAAEKYATGSSTWVCLYLSSLTAFVWTGTVPWRNAWLPGRTFLCCP